MSNFILLVTACGDGYGSGHYRRQLTLLQWLRWHTDCTVRMFFAEGQPPAEITEMIPDALCDTLPAEATLVVRDMRDSTPGEIARWSKIGPVCVLDDLGEGRKNARRAIDLLPNLIEPSRAKGAAPFLYGFNFIHGLELAAADCQRARQREFDLLVYAAQGGGLENIDQVQRCVPPEWKVCVVGGTHPLLLEDGCTSVPGISYVDALRNASLVMSHFGIMLFEARLAGCRLLALNPSTYHSALCDAAQEQLDCINLGVATETKPDIVRLALERERLLAPDDSIDPAIMLAAAQKQVCLAARLVAEALVR